MPIMPRVLQFALKFIAVGFRSRLSLQFEVAALRHQLSFYQARGRRPAIRQSDWRRALYFVQSRTVTTWQRKRFRDYWRELGRSRGAGRPSISPELRRLIRRMWRANPTWGSPRIVAELRMLGIDVAKSRWKSTDRICVRSAHPPGKPFSVSTFAIL